MPRSQPTSPDRPRPRPPATDAPESPSVAPASATYSAGRPAAAPRARAIRLAVVVAVACAVVAVGVTGSGLLLPGDAAPSALRTVAAVAAVAAAGVLVRLDGPARAAWFFVALTVASAVVCALTYPASPVSLRFGGDDVVVGDAGRPAPRTGRPTLGIPEATVLTVEGGQVIADVPGVGRVILGQTGVDAADPAIPAGGTELVVIDGQVRRADGGALGPSIGLGDTTLAPADGGALAVGDDEILTVPDPIDGVEDTDPIDALLAVALLAFAFLAFAPPLVRVSERLGVRLIDDATDPEPDADPVAAATSMEEGLSDLLRAMMRDEDPRTAVIGTYGRLLRALSDAGYARRDEEGPHEHLWRVLGPLGARRAPVHQLAELFVRARFSPKPITEAHRRTAVGALADAIADLRVHDDGAHDDGVHDELTAILAATGAPAEAS